MGIFKNIKSRFSNVKLGERYKMVTERGDGFYSWNGNLYRSDIVRACIRPKAKAIGKLLAKHIRTSGDKIQTNPDVYMRFLLEEPNPFMSGQVMQEKVATQLMLNNNAFILIVKDENGIPSELYPIPCESAESVYINNELFLKFYYSNGKSGIFPYSDIIHIREDFYNSDIFGESPAQALTPLMEIVTVTDQGIIKAIKNSGVIRWLLKFTGGSRPEDVKRMTSEFVNNYLNIESDTIGAAGVNGNVDVQRIEPKDYVPNALQIDRTTQRIYLTPQQAVELGLADKISEPQNAPKLVAGFSNGIIPFEVIEKMQNNRLEENRQALQNAKTKLKYLKMKGAM